jgi:hypothetical protein
MLIFTYLLHPAPFLFFSDTGMELGEGSKFYESGLASDTGRVYKRLGDSQFEECGLFLRFNHLLDCIGSVFYCRGTTTYPPETGRDIAKKRIICTFSFRQ